MAEAKQLQAAKSRAAHGFALLEQGRLEEPAGQLAAAIEAQPDFAEAHYGLSWTMPARGDFERGLVENEWRTKCKSLAKAHGFLQPRWDGADLNGKAILLHQEQGLGDVIQYVRYVPLVAERGGCVFLGCNPDLARLIQYTPGITMIVPSEDHLPPFDVHLSLHSLPHIFRTTLETIPATVPYVFPDPTAITRW